MWVSYPRKIMHSSRNEKGTLENTESDGSVSDESGSSSGFTVVIASGDSVTREAVLASIEMLLQRGADVDLRDDDDVSPLHVISHLEDPDLIGMLATYRKSEPDSEY